jgi:hypothetical protein
VGHNSSEKPFSPFILFSRNLLFQNYCRAGGINDVLFLDLRLAGIISSNEITRKTSFLSGAAFFVGAGAAARPSNYTNQTTTTTTLDLFCVLLLLQL